MAQAKSTYTCPARQSHHVQSFLKLHLPRSLPLLRRLQYHSQHESAIVACSFDLEQSRAPETFALGYYDPASRDAWLFSSLEAACGSDTPDSRLFNHDLLESSLTCLRSTFASFKQRWEQTSTLETVVLVHCVNSNVANALRGDPAFRAVRDDIRGQGGPYSKYLMNRANDVDCTLPNGYYYDRVNTCDHELIVQNNELVGHPRNLVGRPSLGIRDSHGRLKAWAFKGPDGCTRTLHVMPECRQQRLGSKIIAKLLGSGLDAYANVQDDWEHTDIALDNIASIRLFHIFGAQHVGNFYWMRIDFTKI